MAEGNYLEIDGSVLEGGGQILRNAVALSALLGRPVRVSRIRAGREKPGLKAQHCASIKLVGRICRADCQGCEKDSQAIMFRAPATGAGAVGGQYIEDIGTAGSISLMFQAALPVLTLASEPSRLTVRGGTNVDFSPPVEHLRDVLAPLLSDSGQRFRVVLDRRGFYPRGGGQATLETQPTEAGAWKPLRMLEQGRVVAVEGAAFACGALPNRVAHEMVSTARARLSVAFPDAQLLLSVDSGTPSVGNGCGLSLVARTSTGCFLGASGLGRRGQPAAEVATDAVQRLLADVGLGACVDEHTQDQVILPMALADGESAVRTGPPTLHTRTAIHVSEAVTNAKFRVTEDPDVKGTWIIACQGVGHTRSDGN